MERGGSFRCVDGQDLVPRALHYTSDVQWPRVSSVPGLRANQKHGKVSLSCIMQAPANDEAVQSRLSLRLKAQPYLFDCYSQSVRGTMNVQQRYL
jgi:hypothetical protein